MRHAPEPPGGAGAEPVAPARSLPPPTRSPPERRRRAGGLPDGPPAVPSGRHCSDCARRGLGGRCGLCPPRRPERPRRRCRLAADGFACSGRGRGGIAYRCRHPPRRIADAAANAELQPLGEPVAVAVETVRMGLAPALAAVPVAILAAVAEPSRRSARSGSRSLSSSRSCLPPPRRRSRTGPRSPAHPPARRSRTRRCAPRCPDRSRSPAAGPCEGVRVGRQDVAVRLERQPGRVAHARRARRHAVAETTLRLPLSGSIRITAPAASAFVSTSTMSPSGSIAIPAGEARFGRPTGALLGDTSVRFPLTGSTRTTLGPLEASGSTTMMPPGAAAARSAGRSASAAIASKRIGTAATAGGAYAYSRSACPWRRNQASRSRHPGERDSTSAQKRGEWSGTSRWATSCSTT
jgi:hypothetical protein